MTLLSTLRFITRHPVNQGRQLRAIARFLHWQAVSRASQGDRIIAWVDGAKFLARRGETGMTGNIYAGLHEYVDMAYLLHVTQPDDCFIDVGANVGSYTLLACASRRAFGHAFEPVPRTYQRLTENVRLNALEHRVQCHRVALGSSEGLATISADAGPMNHVVENGGHSDKTIQISMRTLDSMVAPTAPTLMKVDVEGFESQVLAGGLKALANPHLHSVIMELNGSGKRYGFDEANIMRRMIDFGFKPCSYDPVLRALAPLDGKNSSSGNTLFIRDEKLIAHRLASAKAFTVFGGTY
jgi:FkbM family methyltransferase